MSACAKRKRSTCSEGSLSTQTRRQRSRADTGARSGVYSLRRPTRAGDRTHGRSPPLGAAPRATGHRGAPHGAQSPRARSRAVRCRLSCRCSSGGRLRRRRGHRDCKDSPRRISPAKNGLPSVSAAMPAAGSRASASSSWPATAIMVPATSSGPRPCRAMRCTPCSRGQGRGEDGRERVMPARASESRKWEITCTAPARACAARAPTVQATARLPSASRSSTTHSGTSTATSPNRPAMALDRGWPLSQRYPEAWGSGGSGTRRPRLRARRGELSPVTLDVTLEQKSAERARRPGVSRSQSTAHKAPRARLSRRPTRQRSPRRGRGGPRRSSPGGSCRFPAQRESGATGADQSRRASPLPRARRAHRCGPRRRATGTERKSPQQRPAARATRLLLRAAPRRPTRTPALGRGSPSARARRRRRTGSPHSGRRASWRAPR